MSGQKGDTVVAVKDIGGIMSEFVSAGTTGVIVDEGGFFSGPMRVKFDGVNEIMDVQDDEIRTSCVSCGVASVVVSAVVVLR